MLEYTERVWRALYRVTDGDGSTITYSRRLAEVFGQGDVGGWIDPRIEALKEFIPQDATVLVVGCGYGFLIERMMDLGWDDVWGIDSSSYIMKTLDSEADSRVAPRIAQGAVGAENIRQAMRGFPDSFDYVIDEDAASAHRDNELPDFYAALESLGTYVIHLVTPLEIGDTGLNWKNANEWLQTAPSHVWVDTRTKEVIS